MSIISVDGLCCGYGGRTILNDVSFTIESPEYVCVIGPNGVGKSPLIKAIDGLIKPTSGRLEIKEKDISDYSLKEL